MAKKWLAYGATGVVSIAVLGVGAVAAAQALDLRTTDGRVIDVGTVHGDGSTVPAEGADTGFGVLSAPTPGEAPSLATPNSIAGPSPFSVVTPGESGSDSTPDGGPIRLPAPSAADLPSVDDVESAPEPESAPSPADDT